MITRNTDYSIQHLRGLSTDTKPTDVPNGSEFREMDTGKKFLFSAAGTEWIEQPCCGGGSGGGGSVEPLIVNITSSKTVLTMDKTALTVYNAFISGTPIIFYETLGSSPSTYHPTIANVVLNGGLNNKYAFFLSIYNADDLDDLDEIVYKKFNAPNDEDFPSYTQPTTPPDN